MKVLHLLGATEDSGGILTVLRNLQTASGSFGTQHSVWVNARYRERRRPPLDYRQTRHVEQESYDHLSLAFRAMLGWLELRRLLRNERFDALHAHSRGSLPIVVALTTMGSREVVFSNHMYARRIGLYQWAARNRRIVTCVLTPNMARHYGLDPSAPNVRIVSECCGDDYFDLPLAAPPPADGRPLRLVGVGSITDWKKWHLVLEALMLLPPALQRRFEFHHWGPVQDDEASRAYDKRLRAMLQDSRLACPCKLHGLSLNVPEVLRTADWFLLPSTNEPCSVALIEALATGMPALVTKSGGNVDIVSEGRTGLLFTPDDAASLSAGLARIAHGEISLASPSEIRESVRPRSATAVAAQFQEIYRQVLRCPRPYLRIRKAPTNPI